MSVIEKILIGACGGLCAVMVKFLGQDFDLIVQNAAILSADQILSYKIGYGILTPILMFLGAILAWVTDEKKRIKLFAIGVAAPAIITTYSGGVKLADGISETQLQGEKIEFSLITTAHAETVQSMPPDSLLQMQEQRTQKTAVQQVTDAISRHEHKAYTTIMTVMVHLVEKGLLTRIKEGKRYRYKVVFSRQEFLKETAKGRLQTLVSDFGDIAVAQFLEQIDKHNIVCYCPTEASHISTCEICS